MTEIALADSLSPLSKSTAICGPAGTLKLCPTATAVNLAERRLTVAATQPRIASTLSSIALYYCCDSLENEMILSGREIQEHLGDNIRIDPFKPENLNPNSYNLTLHPDIMTYEEVVLDMRKANRIRRMTIPDSGMVLEPNRLYLARTVEHTETHNLIPMIEGRSSIGRLGLFVHITAGFGDVGFNGYWTLEMFAVQPVKIYPGVSICQIFYHQICGDIEEYQSDKYQNNSDIQPSLLYKELNPEGESEDPQMTLGFRK